MKTLVLALLVLTANQSLAAQSSWIETRGDFADAEPGSQPYPDLPQIYQPREPLMVASLTSTQKVLERESPASSQTPEESVWSISTDNDLFVPTQTDRDYTAGVSITYTGKAGVDYWGALDNILQFIDLALQMDQYIPDMKAHTPGIEFGVYGFTPDRITAQETVLDDRPYASLVYLSASRIYVDRRTGDAWTSSLTVGALGLDIFKQGQNTVHDIIGSDRAEGWGHQVSDGGEATFRYHQAFHDNLSESRPSAKIKATYYGSVGYLTEAGMALTFRNGLISSPDDRFNPELTSYGEHVNDAGSAASAGNESYFWGGLAIKARFFNAFLEGQFRHSDHTIDRSALRPLLLEAWLGYTQSFDRGFKLSYVARGQTSEIEGGEGDRELFWGGMILSKSV